MGTRSIRSKLLLTLLGTVFTALLLNSVLLFIYELSTYRRSTAAVLSTTAEIIAANSAAVFLYGDETFAREILGALRAERQVEVAALYDHQGRVFATYATGSGRSSIPRQPSSDGVHFTGSNVVVVEPVMQQGKRYGTLYIRASLTELHERLGVFAAVLALIAVGSGAFSVMIANFFQNRISRPILELAESARTVAERKDYSRRTRKLSDDELGYLTDAFNGMLAQIQEREASLRDAQAELRRYAAQLETRVAERTRSLQELTDQLNSFVYSIAHDLKGPLRTQIAFLNVLLEDYAPALGEEGRNHVRRVLKAAERQADLIRDLLDHVKVSRQDLPIQEVDLATAIEDVCADLAAEVRQKNAVLEAGATEGKVLANPTSLHLIILNLVSNALKFVEDGVAPHVRLWSERHNGMVTLSVEDNGIGIDKAHFTNLFGLFHRLHPSNSYPGTGIGLAIVKKAVERMGGRVGVDSEVGRGSRFWVELRDADATGELSDAGKEPVTETSEPPR